MTIYHYLCYALIYSFLGWCTEVAYAAIKEKRFVNRGFLNGPICPIYGVGVVLAIILCQPFIDTVVVLFFVSMTVVTLSELIAGFLMDKLFHHKWWDYSNVPFNIGGYVCLPFSLIWGVVCVFVLRVFQPLVERFVNFVPRTLGLILVILFLLTLVADTTVTTVATMNLNKQLESMQKIASELHQLSDKIGINIYSAMDSTNLAEIYEKVTDDQQERIKELSAKYKDLLKGNIIRDRLLRAFPKMESRRDHEMLETLKERVRKIKTNSKKK